MIKPEIEIVSSADKLPEIFKALRELDLNRVLIGIPAENASRTSQDGRPVAINNAALGYLHEHGAPEANIPARPHLIPGVRKIQPEAMRQLRNAVLEALKGNTGVIKPTLMRLGVMGRDSVKSTMTAGLAPPLAAATIKARLRRRRSWSLGKRQKIFAGLQPGDIKPLIDTGALLNAYTYVIRDK